MTIHASSDLLAHDDTGGEGPLVVLLPGAGDVRSEHRHLAPVLTDAGYRVVTADLPGHGDSPLDDTYGVTQTAGKLLELIGHLGGGPAVVVGASFSPAAAVWAATTAPEAIRGIVAISAHMESDTSLMGTVQRIAISTLLRGPLAAPMWTRFYRSWYPTEPADLDDQLPLIEAMMRRPERRRAVRETLVADRKGMEEKLDSYRGPSLVVYGTHDDHFPDPAGTASVLAERLGGTVLMVEGAGHYPHVEQPNLVGKAVLEFLQTRL